MAAHSHAPMSGRITRGLKPRAFLEKTIDFIGSRLPEWRDDATRPGATAEEELNGQLCKFLNDRARVAFPMAVFHHEEKQGSRRRVDISASPSTKAIEAALYESIYVPYLVIEGKRLPAPTTEREREYITGLADRSGGVQRFRLGLHGNLLESAVIVAYVQNGKVADWLKLINKWIQDLEASREDITCSWSQRDCLTNLVDDGEVTASRCESTHQRVNNTEIRIVHFWICMA